MKLYRIDIHHHIIPSEYKQELGKIGIAESLGRSCLERPVETSLEVMDANGILAAVTSISRPGMFFGDKIHARKMARLADENVFLMQKMKSG